MFAIGVVSFFNMPPSLTQTKTWFRPKGWFTEREEVIIVNKILRDDPTKVMNTVFVKRCLLNIIRVTCTTERD